MTTTPDEPAAVGPVAKVVPLSVMRTVVAAADAKRTPEVGQRTPQPTITRWTRAGLTDLTIGDVAGILRAGEQGQTVRLVDLWLRMLKTDSHLASVWISRIAPVAAARWELSPGEGPEDTAAAARRLRDACEEAMRGLGNLEPLFTRLLGGIGPGYSVAEIIWGRRRLLATPAWAPSKIKPVHARRFQFSDEFELGLYDDSRAVSQLEADGHEVDVITGRGGVMARLPAGKYLVHQPPTIDDYPTATGLVHPIARWWWAKQKVQTYWLGGAEVAANPRLIGKILRQGDPDAAQALLDGLEALANDGVAITREGTEIDIRAGLGESSGRVWAELAKFLDAAMSKAVLGSTLNVEIGDSGGNRAAAESQGETTIDPRKDMDGAQLWATIQDQLFRFVREYNPHLFGPDTPLPIGSFVFAEPPVEVDAEIISAGGVSMDELRESRGLTPWGGERGERIATSGDDLNAFQPAPAAPSGAPSVEDAPEGLDIPPAADEPEDVQQTALNGAQVTALLEIVGQVVAGLLPRQTAIEVIVSAFPIDRQQADRILGDVGKGFEPASTPETDAPIEDAPPDMPAAEPPEVAASDVPFPRPSMSALMSLVRAKGRETLGGSDVTQTSMPWRTTPSAKKLSE